MRTLRIGRLIGITAALVVVCLAAVDRPSSALDDVTPPVVKFTTPAAGGSYARGATVKASYSCTDSGSGVTACVGTGSSGSPIFTQTLGTHDFFVLSMDGAGNKTKVTHTYTVVDKTAPTISISSPTSAGSYVKGSSVVAIFRCQDDAGGSGVASCIGTVGSGDFLNTSTTGSKTFTVTATDGAGNKSTAKVTYKVVK